MTNCKKVSRLSKNDVKIHIHVFLPVCMGINHLSVITDGLCPLAPTCEVNHFLL